MLFGQLISNEGRSTVAMCHGGIHSYRVNESSNKNMCVFHNAVR